MASKDANAYFNGLESTQMSESACRVCENAAVRTCPCMLGLRGNARQGCPKAHRYLQLGIKIFKKIILAVMCRPGISLR